VNLSDYACADYFESEYARTGHWSEDEQVWLIVPATEIEELRDFDGQPLNFLRVGRPGVDGVSFGYRKGQKGFWAYLPIESEFQYLAATIREFLTGWSSRTISI
jgi:hypothetical protein